MRKPLAWAVLGYLALACCGCSRAGNELEQEYVFIDNGINSDNATYGIDHFAPDFTLTLDKTLKPGDTFIFEDKENFQDEYGHAADDATVMRRHEFQVRLNFAASVGDRFSTSVDSVNLAGDSANVTFTRTQHRRLDAAHVLVVRYHGHDEWKKQAEGWRLTTEHLDDVKLGDS